MALHGGERCAKHGVTRVRPREEARRLSGGNRGETVDPILFRPLGSGHLTNARVVPLRSGKPETDCISCHLATAYEEILFWAAVWV